MGFEKVKRPLLTETDVVLGGVAASTVGATGIPFRGIRMFNSTGAGKLFHLGAPAKVGAQVRLVCRQGTTTNTAFVVLPTGYSFQRTSNSTGTTHRKMVFNAGNQMAHLLVISTARVAYIAPSGVTVTTT
jgi:hypothetical protein